jgi:hypothetical protein
MAVVVLTSLNLPGGNNSIAMDFDTMLPTGESAVGAMNDYRSMSAGALFTHRQQSTNIVVGAAGYHFNTLTNEYIGCV